VFHIGNFEIGKHVECSRDRNMAPVCRRKEQVACTAEMQTGTEMVGKFLNNK